MNWLVFRTDNCPTIHRLLFRLSLVPVLFSLGCQNQWQSSSEQNSSAAHATASDNASVASGLSPTEVAKAALLFIEAKDKVALQRLVAVKKVKKDIESITQGRSAFQGMVDKAVPLALGAISSEINGLDAGDRAIDKESITGDTAVVTVNGKRAGQAQTRRFFLVREDSQWRLVPSLAATPVE